MQPADRISAFIKTTFFVDDFSNDDSFLGTALVDSLGIVQLVGFVEQEFGIKVSDPELVPENFDSVNRVAAFVERKQSTAAAA